VFTGGKGQKGPKRQTSIEGGDAKKKISSPRKCRQKLLNGVESALPGHTDGGLLVSKNLQREANEKPR